jgi:hypothetical protein
MLAGENPAGGIGPLIFNHFHAGVHEIPFLRLILFETRHSLLKKQQAQTMKTKNKLPLAQYNYEGIFMGSWEDVKTAAKFYGVSSTHISSKIGTNKYACFSRWRYTRSEKDIQPFFYWKENKIRLKLTRKVHQMVNGKIMKTWPSISEAARQHGIAESNISDACNSLRKDGTRKQSGGFEWKYADRNKKKFGKRK